MDLELQGKVTIVTGSSDGIGLSVAHTLARKGAPVVLCAPRETLLAQARARIETGVTVDGGVVRGIGWAPTGQDQTGIAAATGSLLSSPHTA